MKKLSDEEKRALTQKMFAQMPPKLPESFERDILKYALPESRYLFFKTGIEGGKKFSTAICSTCGKTVRFGRTLTHTSQKEYFAWDGKKNWAVCPECREKCMTIAARYSHKYLWDAARYAVLQAGEDGGLWARVFAVAREYAQNGPGTTLAHEQLRVYLNAEKRVALRWKQECVFGEKPKWKLSGRVNWNADERNFYECGVVYIAKNARTIRELRKTPFRYADLPGFLKKYPETDFIAYLGIWAKNPNIEKLMKAGFGWAVRERVGRGSCKGAINWRAKDLRGFFFGESLDVIHAMAKEITCTQEMKAYLRLRKLLGLGIAPEDFKRARKLSAYVDDIERIADAFGSGKKGMKYVRQQVKGTKKLTEKNQPCHAAYSITPDECSVLRQWKDYVRLAAECGIRLQGRDYAPADLSEAHDEVLALWREQQEEKKRTARKKKEESVSDRFGKRLAVLEPYTLEKDGLLIRPCATPREMTEEGLKLQHCVDTYLDDHANGVSNIFLIRRESEPNEPYYTLELNKELDRVVQWHGFQNDRCKPRDPAVQKFIGVWMSEVVLPMSKRKAGKQAPAGQVKNRQPIAVAV